MTEEEKPPVEKVSISVGGLNDTVSIFLESPKENQADLQEKAMKMIKELRQ